MRSRLVVSCPDQPGIVAAIAGFLFDSGANILSSAQHSGERFFLRMEFEHTVPLVGFDAVAARFGMNYSVTESKLPKRVAILVSREQHCLLDLLWRQREAELNAEIAAVISNHRDAEANVVSLDEPFFHVPNTRDIREEAEREMVRILEEARADLVVLARYMQILSGEFLARIGVPVINIHHSFLPAFAGADPYGRAHERGVKIIGATAHYVTEELDAGPIIEQDVERVTHADDVAALRRTGRDIERSVLARAVRWHLEDRVLVDGPRTVVF
ncbi:MAG: Formyltetrahydrofolate deformylase [uncultured Solirubrobacteraceae bacterium]|uniref:Formyltetrahydrofolate deformylase n=1 Tax=uncultured Solirubrobacteraceae bacterium TaxID=1162706 RepID=A0A6J4RJZ7_9ACTN|nr:MAG: Formyltetrahydrofolate deformylase [uncultured Solirubrobacteraceae bacterium]